MSQTLSQTKLPVTHTMVKCWNCEHLTTVYSGEPAKGRLFEKEYYRCKVKGIDLKMYYKVRKDRECEEYEERRYWLKK